MPLDVEKRHIPEIVYPLIKDRGLREGDEFILDLFQEKKRSFYLNRSRYQFELAENYEFETIKAHIKIPRFSKQEGRFSLELITANLNQNEAIYMMKALDETPFKVNGVYSFESFLERGDILEIGYNQISFPKKTSKESSNYLPAKNILTSLIPICIEGETGTGKTTLARKIHEESHRMGNFVHLNLSSFSAGLIESEIFGHIKGAFTGAFNSKKGALLEAHKGTLFLDEIDSLSIELQTKLLIFLDSYEFRSVGSEFVQKADIRLIIASGQDLKGLVDQSKMRKDFYFRIKAGVSIKINSLKEDPKQIKIFCENFEREQYVVIDKNLIAFYVSCSFPGNFRQLKSHLLKKKIYADGKKIIFDKIDEDLITNNITEIRNTYFHSFQTLEKVKVEYCYNVFLKMNSNILKTAKVLELSPNTLKGYLSKKIKKLEVH